MREIIFFERWGFAFWFGYKPTTGPFFEKRRREMWIGKFYAVWDFPSDLPGKSSVSA